MKNIFLLLLASILLAGCSARTTEPVVPVISTLSLTAPKSPHPTFTLLPTVTQEPTQTPAPILVTREAALDSCRGNSPDRIDKYITQAYSTNNFWSTTICQDNGIYTKVVKLGKDKVWKIPALDTDETTSGADWFWEPYLWSVDGDYLYLTPKYLGFIDSPWLIYSNGFGLARLDLSTGLFDTWLKPRDGGYTFALSEDGRLFASLSDIPRTINIRDVKTLDEQKLNFREKYKILEIRWTPDGANLIIFTEETADDPSQSGFSIFVYNFERDDLTKLVDKNNLNSLYSSDEFEEPRIHISDQSNEILSLSDTLQDGYFEVNLQTGEVIQMDDLGTPITNP